MENDAFKEINTEYRVSNFVVGNCLSYHKHNPKKLLTSKKIDTLKFKAKFLKLKKKKIPTHSISVSPILFTCGYKVIKNTSYILN